MWVLKPLQQRRTRNIKITGPRVLGRVRELKIRNIHVSRRHAKVWPVGEACLKLQALKKAVYTAAGQPLGPGAVQVSSKQGHARLCCAVPLPGRQ